MSLRFYLGVDGGGTKTDFVLVDSNGNLAASCQGPGAYHLEIGIDGLRDMLREGLATLYRQAGIERSAVTYAFFGIPAYGEDSAAQALLDAIPQPLLGHGRYRCGNDMVCGWAGSLGGADGINIVAGTGSIAYGERRGKSARAGGWGELFGDEGSAYWLAVQGLNAFSRMSDGRLPKGPLHATFKAAFGLDVDLDMCGKVMSGQARSNIAAYSRLVVAAALAGDMAAIRIVDDAAHELAAIADSVRQALTFEPGEVVPVSYSGGVFEAASLILDPLQRHLDARYGGYRLQAPLIIPSGGAAIYAAKLATEPFSSASIARLARILGPTHLT